MCVRDLILWNEDPKTIGFTAVKLMFFENHTFLSLPFRRLEKPLFSARGSSLGSSRGALAGAQKAPKKFDTF